MDEEEGNGRGLAPPLWGNDHVIPQHYLALPQVLLCYPTPNNLHSDSIPQLPMMQSSVPRRNSPSRYSPDALHNSLYIHKSFSRSQNLTHPNSELLLPHLDQRQASHLSGLLPTSSFNYGLLPVLFSTPHGSYRFFLFHYRIPSSHLDFNSIQPTST
jgi:hypothetical protein